MKFTKHILAAVLVTAALILPAKAAPDVYGDPIRTIQLPATIVTATSSNFPYFDMHSFAGVVKLDVFSSAAGVPNPANQGTLTLNVQTGDDTSNWVALANYSLATNSLRTVTNIYWAQTVYASNSYNFPGLLTTPKGTNGYIGSPYLSPSGTQLFTNSGSILLGTNTTTIGFNVQDQKRYLQFVVTQAGGSSPTNILGAVLTGVKAQTTD